MDDFLYICDDAYKREELVAMERSILRTLNFDINIPIPYRFLRRFAKVGGCPLLPPPRGPPAALGGRPGPRSRVGGRRCRSGGVGLASRAPRKGRRGGAAQKPEPSDRSAPVPTWRR